MTVILCEHVSRLPVFASGYVRLFPFLGEANSVLLLGHFVGDPSVLSVFYFFDLDPGNTAH